jgi:hypothetical protein
MSKGTPFDIFAEKNAIPIGARGFSFFESYGIITAVRLLYRLKCRAIFSPVAKTRMAIP